MLIKIDHMSDGLFLYLNDNLFFSNLNSTTMYKVLCFLIVVSFLGIGSCKKKSADPDNCGASWAAQLSTEINAVAAAAQTYSSNPTTPNCNALKTAYQKYLDALQPFTDCTAWTTQQKNDLQDAINEAEQEISTLCQ
jgi:hypothetical protein